MRNTKFTIHLNLTQTMLFVMTLILLYNNVVKASQKSIAHAMFYVLVWLLVVVIIHIPRVIVLHKNNLTSIALTGKKFTKFEIFNVIFSLLNIYYTIAFKLKSFAVFKETFGLSCVLVLIAFLAYAIINESINLYQNLRKKN